MSKNSLPPGVLLGYQAYLPATKIRVKQEAFFADRSDATAFNVANPDFSVSRLGYITHGSRVFRVGLTDVSRLFPTRPSKDSTYCLGFAFSEDFTSVVLLVKNRPDWQAGKLNGIGGHVEAGESSIAAMVREFKEETGIKTIQAGWSLFSSKRYTVARSSYVMDSFVTVLTEAQLKACTSKTDEVVKVMAVRSVLQDPDLPNPPMYNLCYLIPEAKVWLTHPEFRHEN